MSRYVALHVLNPSHIPSEPRLACRIRWYDRIVIAGGATGAYLGLVVTRLRRNLKCRLQRVQIVKQATTSTSDPHSKMNTRSAAQKATVSSKPPTTDAQITKFFKTSSTARPATGGIRKRPVAPKQKHSAGYAPPSKFAHVQNSLSDTLEPGLICVFIGLNPGIQTATTGHAYAHPSNLFWRLLHSSGCTPRRCAPSETYALPQLYGLGNTNIVERPTANGAQLSKEEMDDGVQILDNKVAKCRPQVVVIVGKSIWESIWRVWKRRAITKTEFKYGWQDDKLRMGSSTRAPAENQDQWPGARVFVATTTSGLAASMKPAEKESIWRQLGEWVEQEREKAGLIGDRYLENGTVLRRA